MLRDDLSENPVVIIQSSQQDYYYRFHKLHEIVVAHSPETVLEKLGRIETAVNEQNLFATIFTALGLSPYEQYDLPGMPAFHRVEDRAEPIHDLLA